MNKEQNARMQVVASMVIFGTIGLFVRSISLPSSVISMTRGFGGTAFLLFFMLLRGMKVDGAGICKNLPLLIFSGGVMGFNWILLFESYRYTTVAISTLCYYMAPTFVMLASPLLLGERMTVRKGICVAAALAGMVLVSGVGSMPEPGELMGVLLGLGAACLYACVVLTNKKIRDIGPYDRTFMQLLSAALVLVPYNMATGALSGMTIDGFGLAMLAVVCLVHTGVAYALYFGAFDSLSAQTAAILSYIDPVLAVILSAMLLHEPMSMQTAFGAVLVLGAAFVCEMPEKK